MGITYKCWAASAAHLAQGTTPAAADSPAWIGLETAAMGAWTASTNAFTTICVAAGLAIANATLTNVTTAQAADTCKSYYLFTCGATTGAITGHACMSASTAGNMMSWYAYAATQNLASGDTLACTIDHQFVAGS